jgi:electron transport complex protein RnfE
VSNLFTKSILKENPIFVMALGLCPALAVSTTVENALGMGVCTLFVLLGANIFVSLLKDFIPSKVRIPAYIVLIATFTAIVEMALQAYSPTLYQNLGVFVPLIAVNCIILGSAEAFANKNKVGTSIIYALGQGTGFTLALFLIAFLREVFGTGTLTILPIGTFDGVIRIPGLASAPIRMFGLAAGAFFIIAFLQAFLNWQTMRKKEK